MPGEMWGFEEMWGGERAERGGSSSNKNPDLIRGRLHSIGLSVTNGSAEIQQPWPGVDTGHGRKKILISQYFNKGWKFCTFVAHVCMIQASLRRYVVIILMGVSYCYYRSESSDPTLTRPEQTEQTTQRRENKPRVTRTGANRGRRARRGKHSFIYKWVSRQIDNGPGNSGNFRSSEQIVNGCPDLRYENIALWHHQWPCPWLWGWGPPIHNIPYPDTMEETPLDTTLSEAQLGSQLLWRQLIGDF